MAINVSQAFHRTSSNPIDETMALTKAQMLLVNDNIMPAYYLTICQDDGAIYLYDKSSTPSVECGKFHKLEAGENYVNNEDLGNLIIDVYNPEKSDYAVDDYVIYLKKLYRCKVANTRNLPTVTTDWDQLNLISIINNKLINYLTEADANKMITSNWNQSRAYAVGEYVLYEREIYRCKTATVANEAWDSTKWDKVTLVQPFNGSIPGLVPTATQNDANKALTGSGTWMEFTNVHVSYDSQQEELHLDFSRTSNIE